MNPGNCSQQPYISRHNRFSILEPNYWLRDDDIDAASFYLSQQHPNVDGFQSSVLFAPLHNRGVVGTPQRPFVQVLHIDDNHWVRASNLFCGPNELAVYDSLHLRLTEKNKKSSHGFFARRLPPSVCEGQPCKSRQTRAIVACLRFLLHSPCAMAFGQRSANSRRSA